MHAVVAADREEIRIALVGGVERGHEFLVARGAVVVVVVCRRDDAERGVAHVLEGLLVGELQLRHDLGLARVDAAIRQRLGDRRRLRAARHEDEDRFRVHVLGALHEGGEVGIGDGIAHRADDLAPGRLERAVEGGFGVMAGGKIRHHRIDLPHPVLVGPDAERLVELRQREGHPRHVGRLGRDDRGGCVHHHHELLRLRRYVGRRHGIGRERETGEEIDLVAHHQLLGEPLGDVGGDAAGILADDLDLPAGDRVAVLLHVELDAVVGLGSGIGELARERQDQADLDGLLGVDRRNAEDRRGEYGKSSKSPSHRYSPQKRTRTENAIAHVRRGEHEHAAAPSPDLLPLPVVYGLVWRI